MIYYKRGGVGAYIRSNLKYAVKDYTVKHTDSIWFEINNGEFQKVMVGVFIYTVDHNVGIFFFYPNLWNYFDNDLN